MNRRRIGITVVGLTAALLALLLAGCGGGGGGVVIQTGLTGLIVEVRSGLGIGGVVVTVAGRSGTSADADGRFTITGLAAGTYALTVQPGTRFVAVPGPAPQVTVIRDRVTDVGTVFVIDRDSLPPAP